MVLLLAIMIMCNLRGLDTGKYVALSTGNQSFLGNLAWLSFTVQAKMLSFLFD